VEEKKLWAHHIKRLILENHQAVIPQKVCTVMIIQKFSDFVGEICLKYDSFLIVGDLNVHVCCSSNALARDFLDMIDSFNLTQHVSGSTHVHGHTLDLIINSCSLCWECLSVAWYLYCNSPLCHS